MPLQIIRGRRENIPGLPVLGLSPCGSLFAQASGDPPPEFNARLEWQSWDENSRAFITDYGGTRNSMLTILVASSGVPTRAPELHFAHPHFFKHMLGVLMWKGTFVSCWTKWTLSMQVLESETSLPSSVEFELPYHTNRMMAIEPEWSETEGLYQDLKRGEPVTVPRYYGQQPRPWTSSILTKQPPQFFDCRRYLFVHWVHRCYMYAPGPHTVTGNQWQDLAWPKWTKFKGRPLPTDNSFWAAADPNEPLPEPRYRGGGQTHILSCIVTIRGQVYPNKELRGTPLGRGSARLEVINVGSVVP